MISKVNIASRQAGTGMRGSAAEKHNTRGIALQVQGKLTEAEACYRRALALKPGFVEAWSNLGAVLLAQRKPREAIAYLQRAIALRPTFTDAYTNLTEALMQAGRVAEASTCWRSLLRLNPNDPDTLLDLAFSLMMERKHTEAFEVNTTALALRPNHPKTLFALGLRYLLLGDFKQGFPSSSTATRASSAVPRTSSPSLSGVGSRSLANASCFTTSRWRGCACSRCNSIQAPTREWLTFFLDPANMADAAAKMLHLDLVIIVDIAHLAGALGLPVWIMLDSWPDWCWLLDREDSPWYPTARLFRQERPGDWSTVTQRVVKALHTFRDQPLPRQPPHGESPPCASARLL